MGSYILALAAICSYLSCAYYCWAVFNNPGWVLHMADIAIRGRKYGVVEQANIWTVLWSRMIFGLILLGFMASAGGALYLALHHINYNLAVVVAGNAGFSALWLLNKLQKIAESKQP